jgi:hypothetical protein
VAVSDESKAAERLQSILDSHVLAMVEINAESRVKVEAGPAQPELVEAGTRLFLVKVTNDAGVTAQLKVESPNSGDVYIQSTNLRSRPRNLHRDRLPTAGPTFLYTRCRPHRGPAFSLYQNPPKLPRLSGLAVGIPNPCDLQPRRGEKISHHQLQCGPGNPGYWLSE